MTDALDCALDLMRRLPPQKIDTNLETLCKLRPDLLDDLLSSVDQPLKVAVDEKKGKDYLLCDYNRDGDSYRSPWSNTYYPPLEDGGTLPSDHLRPLEIEANSKFDTYREMYFDSGVSSVYLWELDTGFAGVVLIKKTLEEKDAKGCWDSIHVVEVVTRSSRVHYRLTSTVMLWLETESDPNGGGCFNLGGSLTRMNENELPAVASQSDHINNIGRLVEEAENKIRQQLNDIYFGTTKNVVDFLRNNTTLADDMQQKKMVQELQQRVGNRSASVKSDASGDK